LDKLIDLLDKLIDLFCCIIFILIALGSYWYIMYADRFFSNDDDDDSYWEF